MHTAPPQRGILRGNGRVTVVGMDRLLKEEAGPDLERLRKVSISVTHKFKAEYYSLVRRQKSRLSSKWHPLKAK